MKAIATFLIIALVFYSNQVPVSAWIQTAPSEPTPLEKLIQRHYLELFELATNIRLSDQAIEIYKKQLKKQKEAEEARLKTEIKSIKADIEKAREELKALNRDRGDSGDMEARRHLIHCRIQKARKTLREKEIALEKGLDIRYDNKFAKLEILQKWPERYRKLQQMIAENRIHERKFSDYKDVGFRGGPFEKQEEDIKIGREAIDELKSQNMLPPSVEDEEIASYIRNLALKIARHSDLQVPLEVTVLRSEEVNAFALPGGFLFINTGLIEKAANEAELAGVIAHEIAHSAARHGKRLMGRANIANIVFQAAQLAAMIFTGGASSIATYYLLQYGFYGLGLVLSLSLLGVSRDFEIEADILGTQYLWHANYYTGGFIDFFERMAQEEGYVKGLSWFRTHPPFAERMTRTYEEIILLPEQPEPQYDSAQFREMKKRLSSLLEELRKRDENAPTLRRVYDCDDVEPE